MAKKGLILAAVLITIVVIISIIISIINLKPVTFKSVVTYNNNTTILKDAPVQTSSSASNSNYTNKNMSFIETLLYHENTVMFFSIVIITIFAILFYGAKRSKS